jgi:4-hydroxybenzoate polyprenyltransferase
MATTALPFDALRVSRPGLWPVTLWLYLLPLGGEHAGEYARDPQFWIGFLYCTFPLNFFVYCLNDVADAEADRLNPRKGKLGGAFGAKLTITQLRRLIWPCMVLQLSFLVCFCVGRAGPIRTILWAAATASITGAYNFGWPLSRRRLSSGRPPLEFLGALGYLLVIPLSTWINGAPMAPLRSVVHTLFLIVRSQLWGELIDLGADAAARRETTAVGLGALRTRLLLCAIVASEAVYAFRAFPEDPWLAGFSCVSLALAVLDLAATPRGTPTARATAAAALVQGAASVALAVHVFRSGTLSAP